MNIFLKITILSFIYILFSIILKNYRPEYVFLLRIFTIITIIYIAINYINNFINTFTSIFNSFSIESSHISLLVKIVGISILTDFITDNLTDNGETAMANSIRPPSTLSSI